MLPVSSLPSVGTPVPSRLAVSERVLLGLGFCRYNSCLTNSEFLNGLPGVFGCLEGWFFPIGSVCKIFGLVLSPFCSFRWLPLSLSLLWLDLKEQATCMLRRLDDAPTHPPPPPDFCLVRVWDKQTSLFLFWLNDFFFPLVFFSCLCRSDRQRAGLTGTLTRTHQGAPFSPVRRLLLPLVAFVLFFFSCVFASFCCHLALVSDSRGAF